MWVLVQALLVLLLFTILLCTKSTDTAFYPILFAQLCTNALCKRRRERHKAINSPRESERGNTQKNVLTVRQIERERERERKGVKGCFLVGCSRAEVVILFEDEEENLNLSKRIEDRPDLLLRVLHHL